MAKLVMWDLVTLKGTPLFKSDPDSKHLRLLEARTLPSGCVILRYEPEPGRGRKS